MATPRVAVFDLDGVLADVTHRLGALAGRRKDWEAFFAAAGADPLLVEGQRLVESLSAAGLVAMYLSGRPERLRATTRSWLAGHGLPEGQLLLRPDGDHRPAPSLKPWLLGRHCPPREVAICVDDDPAAVAALRRAGFPAVLADWAPDAPSLRRAQRRDGRT